MYCFTKLKCDRKNTLGTNSAVTVRFFLRTYLHSGCRHRRAGFHYSAYRGILHTRSSRQQARRGRARAVAAAAPCGPPVTPGERKVKD